jgi:hypothetical protein
MSDAKVRGMVHVVEETKSYGQKGFRKRLVVLEQDNGRFVNYVPIDFTGDNCDSVDSLKPGDEIEVTYRLSGRKWQRDANSEVKYFLNAEAIRFAVVGESRPVESFSPNDAFDEASGDDDDVPF